MSHLTSRTASNSKCMWIGYPSVIELENFRGFSKQLLILLLKVNKHKLQTTTQIIVIHTQFYHQNGSIEQYYHQANKET